MRSNLVTNDRNQTCRSLKSMRNPSFFLAIFNCISFVQSSIGKIQFQLLFSIEFGVVSIRSAIELSQARTPPIEFPYLYTD